MILRVIVASAELMVDVLVLLLSLFFWVVRKWVVIAVIGALLIIAGFPDAGCIVLVVSLVAAYLHEKYKYKSYRW